MQVDASRGRSVRASFNDGFWIDKWRQKQNTWVWALGKGLKRHPEIKDWTERALLQALPSTLVSALGGSNSEIGAGILLKVSFCRNVTNPTTYTDRIENIAYILLRYRTC